MLLNPIVLLDVLDHGIFYIMVMAFYRRDSSLLKKTPGVRSKKIFSPPDESYYLDLKPDWKPKEVIEI